MEENRQELLEILEETRPDIDFENDISINVNDLLPENFNSVDAILALIAKLQEE